MAYTTIDDPTKFFSTNLWVGDDTSPRTLTGFGHQPDFVWARYRDGGSLNNVLTNKVSQTSRELTPGKIIFGFEGDATDDEVNK